MGMEMILLLALVLGPSYAGGDVTYDGRSLIIDGTRRILFSGSIHYPRSTPQMWPGLISKAKQGGIDVIQTYVFWNVHEPVQGQFNFHGRYDLVGFIKEVQKQGLYASLRIGPFIQAEWRYGGFPFWLYDVPGIVFRSDNDLFKYYMKRYASKIVGMMKAEGLYASQGGPIILSQIENEYKTVEAAFHEKGPPYVRWAASMAVGLKTGVPWMMCKQDDAPDPVINACNGMRCGETFVGPNSPTKPAIWTENWTSFIQVYGSEPYIRSAEDIAFTVALFIAAMNGSFVNYYMYHGGTNFGRSAASYMITAYYDQAPLDEYGLIRQPKWGHLRELHAAIKGCSETLLHGSYSEFSLGKLQEGHVFQDKSGKCVAFIANKDRNMNANVQFHNTTYWLPARSISILPDCKNAVFNTAKVSTQHGIRSTNIAQNLVHGWEAFRDEISNYEKASFSANALLDHMNVTKDETDYLWYSISYESTPGNYEHTLHVVSRAHVVHAFVDDDYLGSSHGNSNTRNTVFEKSISLKDGKYDISLLSVMVGSPDSGAYLEHRTTGLRRVKIQSSSDGPQDTSNHQWGYKIGLLGEKLKIYTQEGLNNVVWGTIESSMHQSLMWYKTTFDAPTGSNPVAINLASMGKGEAWINGESIGRYWVSFKTPKGQPSQTLYHIPSSFTKPSGNLLVLFEEMGGNPHLISLETISISSICGIVSDSQPPSLFSRRGRPSVKIKCHDGRTISAINFASYGTPIGDCEQYAIGSCHSSTSKAVVEKACLSKRRCSVDVSNEQFGKDPCPEVSKSLLVAASCH